MTIRTALAGGALLWGDEALFNPFQQPFRSGGRARHRPRFRRGQAGRTRRRHAKHGLSRYVLEPNIKDGKGGLRDLHTLFWIGKYLYEVEDRSPSWSAGRCSDREESRPVRRKARTSCGPCAAICIDLTRPARGTPDLRRAARLASAWATPTAPACGRRALHEALLPDRQGCRRPDAHLLRRDRGPAPAQAPRSGLPGLGMEAAISTAFQVAGRPADRCAGARPSPKGPGQDAAHLRGGAAQRPGHPSRRAAMDHPQPARSTGPCARIRRAPTACSWTS